MSHINAISSFFITLSKLVGVMPHRLARTLFAGVGMAISRLWISERKRIYETISRVFHRMGAPTPDDIDSIIDKLFINYALSISEILDLPYAGDHRIISAYQFSGEENLKAAIERGRGVILVVPHLDNWELLGASIVRRGYNLHSFYLSQKKGELGSLLDHFRSYSGIVLHDRDRGGIGALKALKKGAILGMIADQDGGNNGIYVDFLGHWVSMPAGPANWSLKTGAAIVPLYGVRNGFSDRHQAVFLPQLPDESSDDYIENVTARTLRIKSWMESVILKWPEQYLWFYNRFKPRHERYIARLKAAGCKMSHGSVFYAVNEPQILENWQRKS